VNPLPDVTISTGGPTTFCSGGAVTFNTSSGNTYQWQLNGSDISTANANNYSATVSGNYSVIVTNANGCMDTSSVQTVTVNPLPSATIIAGGPISFCDGDSVLLTSGAGATYQWMYNGSNISGATSNSYIVSDQGNYNVIVSDGICSATSSATFVTVNPLPALPVITQTGATLSSTFASGYQWYLNGIIIPGATLQTYNISANGSYTVIVTNSSGCESISDPLIITTTDMIDMVNSNEVNIYPNPYVESTSIEIMLSDNAKVIAEVYSVLGEKIQTLVSSDLSAGKHSFNFGAKQFGYSSGVYFVKVSVNDKINVIRIIENN
jgi:hypothetical protein